MMLAITREKHVGQWALHVHHRWICEPLMYPIELRRQFIRDNKDPKEIEVRLRVLRELTEEEVAAIPLVYRQAGEGYRLTLQSCNHVGDVYEQARRAYDKIQEEYRAEMEDWHRSVCVPDCPWDGTTLFPERRRECK